MRLLVTRPRADAVELQAHLVARGHEVRLAPLLEIDFDDPDPIELEDVQALIATSKNGVRALARQTIFAEAKLLPLLAVGPGTAATAEALGFEAVVRGPRAARDLVPIVAEGIDVNAGPLLHLAGDKLAFDLAGELQRLGYRVLQPMVYRTRAVDALPAPVVAELAEGLIHGVILLSPQTARIWSGLIMTHGLAAAVRRVLHLCLSDEVRRALDLAGDIRSSVAKKPNLDEMLAAIDGAAANWRDDNQR